MQHVPLGGSRKLSRGGARCFYRETQCVAPDDERCHRVATNSAIGHTRERFRMPISFLNVRGKISPVGHTKRIYQHPFSRSMRYHSACPIQSGYWKHWSIHGRPTLRHVSEKSDTFTSLCQTLAFGDKKPLHSQRSWSEGTGQVNQLSEKNSLSYGRCLRLGPVPRAETGICCENNDGRA
jgi:hypothetical protein